MALLVFGALVAADAGRVGESGGATWIAPELLAQTALAQPCSHTTAGKGRELVFATIAPGELADEAPLFGAAGREVVSFEWNATTGELSYHTSAPTAVFSDLVTSSPASADPGPSCESR